MWNRTLRLSLPVTLAVFSMIALAGAEDGAGDGGVVRYILGARPYTLDPHRATGLPESTIIEALYEGLVYRDPRTMKPRPGVAESWEISPDGRIYTFHLRKKAVWSDGTQVTAHDFARSWRRMLLPDTGCEFAYLYYGIRGARALCEFRDNARRILDSDLRRPSLLNSLAALVEDNADGLEGRRWREFAVRSGFLQAVAGTKDALLREAMVGTRPRWSALDLEKLQTQLEIAGRHRRREHTNSLRGFGSEFGVIPKDARTLVVQLEAPQPYFLELTSMAAAAPVPLRAEQDPRDPLGWWCSRAAVVNGPYRVEGLSERGDIRLAKNPTYWEKDSIRADTIEALGIEDPEEGWQRFQKGGVHWLATWPIEKTAEVRKQPGFREVPGHVTYFYRLNCLHPVLRDVRVRRALALALDRKALIAATPGLHGRPSGHFVPLGMPGYLPPKSDLVFDPERARALLEEAGHPLGKGISPLRLLFNTNEMHKLIADAAGAQWKSHLGLDVKPRWQEWVSFVRASHALEYDIARAGWIGDYTDPATFLNMFVSDSPDNYTGWGNAHYDALVRAAADMTTALAEPDAWLGAVSWREQALKQVERAKGGADGGPRRALRLRLLREAEAILLREVPVIPVYQYVLGQVVHPDLRGYHTTLVRESDEGGVLPNAEGIHPLRALYLAK